MAGSELQTVLEYHRRTKHRPGAYARSAGYLDWANQPEPFRFYAGRPPIRLPLLDADPEPQACAAAFTAASIGGLLELCLGLSAWKVAGASRWALRINPSSGNLHPTEAHLAVSPQILPEAGLCHYNPLGHMLEPRSRIDAALWQSLTDHLGGEGLLVGLTSIFWREAWKYGERAWRYCQLDIGHALAALNVAAGFFGWRTTVLEAIPDEDAARVLGLDRTVWPPDEAEQPELLAWIHPADRPPAAADLPSGIIAAFRGLELFATPSRLSSSHVDWEIIGAVAKASRRTGGQTVFRQSPVPAATVRPATITPAIVRQRRSGQAYDAGAAVSAVSLARILSATLPGSDRPAIEGCGSHLPVGLVVWAHRVDGLPAGLYWYERHPGMAAAAADASAADLDWMPVPAIDGLFRLDAGDFHAEARRLACLQDIASDGVFCIAMVAAFQDPVSRAPHSYRELFWTCGRIGQALYLAAEAEGLRGTGIGCFFDDEVHARLGWRDERYQCLYQFTVGRPIPDRRLATEPPYGHLQRP